MSLKKNTLLNFSPHESEVMGLRIARGSGRFSKIPHSQLLEEIKKGEFDLCKIKVRADQPEVFTQLDALGLPWQVMSVLYRNVAKITPKDGEFALPEGISYEAYDGSQSEILGKFVEEAIGKPTGVNFSTWPFDRLFSPQKQLELSKAYSLGFVHGADHCDLAWLLLDQGKYVGFFLGSFADDHFEGTLYGVPPQFRGRGYGKVIYGIMKKICFERGVKYFYTDVQLQNAASQQSTLKGGLKTTGYFFHVFLTAFMSFGKEKSVRVKLDSENQALPEIMKMAGEQGLPKSLKKLEFESFSKGKISFMDCWCPFQNDEGKLWLGKISDNNNRIKGIIYARF